MNRLENPHHTLTALSPEKETLKSEYGITSYLEWCEKESARINANGGSTKVYRSHGECAVINR